MYGWVLYIHHIYFPQLFMVARVEFCLGTLVTQCTNRDVIWEGPACWEGRAPQEGTQHDGFAIIQDLAIGLAVLGDFHGAPALTRLRYAESCNAVN